MMRSSVRSAGFAILLTMNGCGSFIPTDPGTKSPGLNVAEAALEGGAGQIALQVSEGVLHEKPDNMQAMAIKGDALTLLGEYDQAAAAFQTILAKDPNSVRANIGLGRVRLNKDPAAAEVLFQAVLKRDSKDLTALNDLGIARDLQGHHTEAQNAYRQALAVNPELDSAQVNLALSLAMTGHGPEAVQLLKAKARDPSAPPKVRRDYAVVLAMSGNRPEAERVLGEDLPPAQVREVLDSATGTHSQVTRDAPATQSAARVQVPQDDPVPPDVVQVPEGQMVQAQTPRMADPIGRVAQTQARPSPMPAATISALAAAPAPMVVHPTTPDTDTPMVQPVNSIAAAMTNQRPLALPVHAADALSTADASSSDTSSGHGASREPAKDPALVTPEVLTMPASKPMERAAAVTQARPAPVRVASTEASPAPLPDAPPPPPILTAAPTPPAYHALPPVARVAAAVRKIVIAPAEAAAPDAVPVRSVLTAAAPPAAPSPPKPADAAITAPPPAALAPAPARAAAEASEPSSTPSRAAAVAFAPVAQPTEPGPAIQFAATVSEESAHTFWQSLVRRFPDALGQREPTVMRFEHGGTVFWRLRTEGFDTLTEAQTLCARMRADGQACFVARS